MMTSVQPSGLRATVYENLHNHQPVAKLLLSSVTRTIMTLISHHIWSTCNPQCCQ